ncbi:hypothetical protein PHYC_02943 [Phycisphaerales bacterium]|nr:hypothetical protein PHYC_02943 [Phycisphaerales bacterium]
MAAPLIEMAHKKPGRRKSDPALNRLAPEDQAAHAWYRFNLSFPPHLVRDYLADFGIAPGKRVLDPFCGTGTTVVECKKLGIEAEGTEANPMAAFASGVKVDWSVSHRAVVEFAEEVAAAALQRLDREGVADSDPLHEMRGRRAAPILLGLPHECHALLLENSISPRPLHKALVLLEEIDRRSARRAHPHARLALARVLVNDASNLHFGPEVGVGPPKADAPVVEPWRLLMREIGSHVAILKDRADVHARVRLADARSAMKLLEPGSIDAVFTSPPYPNEKDYTRTTRLESVVLGFLRDMKELRSFKQGLVRSNTRTVYKADDDDQFVAGNRKVQALAEETERRRIEMGKTSGFERVYHRVTRLYFGGMARHLAELRPALKPGAMLGYVVGDQASYLRVMIRTGELLAEIAQGLGYDLVRIDLFRTRLATATREQLREETVVLRWPG